MIPRHFFQFDLNRSSSSHPHPINMLRIDWLLVAALLLSQANCQPVSQPPRVLIEGWFSYLHALGLVNLQHVAQMSPFLTHNSSMSAASPCSASTAFRPALGDSCIGDGDCCFSLRVAEVPPWRKGWTRTAAADMLDATALDRVFNALQHSIDETHDVSAVTNQLPDFPLLSYFDAAPSTCEVDVMGHSDCQTSPTWRFDVILRYSLPINIYIPSLPDSSSVAAPPRLYVFIGAETLQLRDEMFVGEQIIPIVPSQWSARALLKHFINPIVIPHGVDTSVFYPGLPSLVSGLRSRANIPPSAISDPHSLVFLHVGSMAPRKNIMGLLQAFYMLARDYKKVYLILKCTNTVASSSQLLRSYMAELDKLDLIKSHTRSSVLNRLIIYQHDLSSPKLADMYRMSDVYIAPFAAEAFNLPVLEAVASGLPVIVPDQGPCVEYAHRPSTIWIPSQIDKISPLNLEDAVVFDQFEIYRAMLNATMNKDKYRIAARGGIAKVKTRFSWSAIVGKLVRTITSAT